MNLILDDSAIHSILIDLQTYVVLNHQMSPECRLHAVVITSDSPDNGHKTKKEKIQ